MRNREFSIIEFVQTFINDRRVARRKLMQERAGDFKL